jgi:soluble lytic murein transglycosylase-like protein
MVRTPQVSPTGPDRRATDRRRGADRRGSLRATAGRRRADRRRGATAGAGLVMAALTLLPSLRGAATDPRPAFSQVRPAPRPGSPEEAAEERADGAPFDAFIEEASALYGVSSDLVRAVIQTESGFNPRAVSGVGAKGLMQLMPRTARALGIEDPFDPKQNIYGGVKYLSTLLEKYNGNVALALASYNAGPGNVRKHGGIPPFRETRGYVKKITGLLAEADLAPDTAGQAAGD